MQRSSIIAILLFIAGCVTTPADPIIAPTTVTEKKQIVVSQEAMKDCEDLKLFTYPINFEDIVVVHAHNTQIYVRCKSYNNNKKEIINKLIIGDKK